MSVTESTTVLETARVGSTPTQVTVIPFFVSYRGGYYERSSLGH